MPSYAHLMLFVVIPFTAVACWIDYAQRRVPNWLNAALGATGLIAQSCYFGWHGTVSAALGMSVGLAVLIVPWAMHGMGAGDVKLMAGIGAWFGPWLCFLAFVLGALIGGLIAAVMITAAGKWAHAAVNMGTILTKVSRKDTLFSEFGSAKGFGSTSSLLPYGIPLSIGAWVVLLVNQFGWGGGL